MISEKTIESLFDKSIVVKQDFTNLNDVNEKLNIATRLIPVGQASQHSAIAAIGVLGKKYDILKEPALKGLNSLIAQEITDPTQNVLDNMNVVTPKLSNWSKIKSWCKM